MAVSDKNNEPWYADYANYLASRVLPFRSTRQEKQKFFSDLRHYFWDEPFLFKQCADRIIRRCVAGDEAAQILRQCHSGPSGGHHGIATTARKVFEAGFYWLHIFRDARQLVQVCDACQRAGNISSRDETPHKYIQVYEIFDVWGIDSIGPLSSSNGNKYILRLFARFGIPKALISDSGTHFYNYQMEKAMKRLFIEKLKSRWYGPFSVSKDMKNNAIELYNEDENEFIINKQRVKPYQKNVLDTNRDDDITLDDEGEKSLYSLKPAPQAWFQRFASYAIRAGFHHNKTDSSLFIFHKGPDTAYLLLYVDDIILTASSTGLLQHIISSLHNKFSMTDLRPLNYFLSISATRTPTSMSLSQSKYAIEILERANMLKCNPCKTLVDTEKKLGPDGPPITDPTLYRSLVGALQYLTFTRPNLSYAVQQLCLYMHDPREPYLTALKHVLCSIHGTTYLGLQLYQSSTSQLISYIDVDWAGCPATRHSTFGYCVFLGDNLFSWSSKRQHTLSRSSVEAEYREVANVIAKTAWIHNLLRELQAPLFTATLVYYDNVSVVYMSANPVQHQHTKHIEIDFQFVRDKVATGHIRVLHVPSRYQYADIFTKGLPYPLFADFRSMAGNGIAGIKQHHRDLSSDGIRNLVTASGRGRLKEGNASSVERIPSVGSNAYDGERSHAANTSLNNSCTVSFGNYLFAKSQQAIIGLKVAFRSNTSYVRNLEGDDQLTGDLPKYEEYFEKRSSETSINFAAQQVDEFNQEDSPDFDGNTIFVPYDALKYEEAESSTTALYPSNMHEFHQEDGIDFEESFAPVARLEAGVCLPVMDQRGMPTHDGSEGYAYPGWIRGICLPHAMWYILGELAREEVQSPKSVLEVEKKEEEPEEEEELEEDEEPKE
ncbi:ribonuclease H-like domain-containing protein [Tanacetum coccineum]